MGEETKLLLIEYAKSGGNLLVIGSGASGIFKDELGIVSAETSAEQQIFIQAGNRLGAVLSVIFETGTTPQNESLSWFYSGNDLRDKTKNAAATSKKLGKGTISAVNFDAGSAYQQYKTPVIRDLLGETINHTFQNQLVKVSGSKLVHVAANTKNGKTYINLLNIAGEHTNQSAIGYDQLPALHDLTVSISTHKKPAKIILQPEGKEMDFSFSNGISTLVVPKLEIHAILEIQN